MEDLLHRELKLGDFVLRLEVPSLDAYGIVIGDNKIATASFIYEGETLKVYDKSYNVINTKKTVVYKIEYRTPIENGIYNTIKQFQLKNIELIAKQKELHYEVIPGDIIAYKNGKRHYYYFYFGECKCNYDCVLKYGAKKITKNVSGYLYLELHSSRIDDLLEKYKFMPYDITDFYDNYVTNKSTDEFIVCTKRKFRNITKKLGHIDLDLNNYSTVIDDEFRLLKLDITKESKNQ